jgi:hypothetical protein
VVSRGRRVQRAFLLSAPLAGLPIDSPFSRQKGGQRFRDSEVTTGSTARSRGWSATRPGSATSLIVMTAREPREPSHAPTSSPGPSFVRRHPVLAAFGVLAGLSLFAAYFPLSALVVGVVVAGRATGLDHTAWAVARRVGDGLVAVIRRRMSPPEPPSKPEPSLPGPEPVLNRDSPEVDVASPTTSRSLRHTAVGRNSLRIANGHQSRSAAPRVATRHRSPAERVGAGVNGPGD